MRMRDDMTFPMSEYLRRLGELRQRMADQQLDAVIITDPENLMYLTDYQTTGYAFLQALVIPLVDEPFMLTRAMEESNVIERTWVSGTRPFADAARPVEELIGALNDAGLGGKRVGYERNSYYLPAYQQDLMHEYFGEGLVDCFGIVAQSRIVKSDVEIAVMRKAAFAAEAGMHAGFAAAIPGATENDVAAAISSAMFRAGGDYPAVMPYVASGPRTMIGHSTWEGRTIEPGEHLFLEVGGCYRRYHAALMRTVVTGTLTEPMYRAQELMKLALAELHDKVGPGTTVGETDALIRRIITSNDVGAKLMTRAGYSIGIAFPPSWDEGYILSLMPEDDTELVPGMTFHIIPWMWGVEGDKTVGISDTIYITESGCESLFTIDQDFVVNAGSPNIEIAAAEA